MNRKWRRNLSLVIPYTWFSVAESLSLENLAMAGLGSNIDVGTQFHVIKCLILGAAWRDDTHNFEYRILYVEMDFSPIILSVQLSFG